MKFHISRLLQLAFYILLNLFILNKHMINLFITYITNLMLIYIYIYSALH